MIGKRIEQHSNGAKRTAKARERLAWHKRDFGKLGHAKEWLRKAQHQHGKLTAGVAKAKLKTKGLITHTMKTIEAKITFTEQVLGTSPNDEDIYRNFIGSKAPDAQTVDEEVESLGVDAVVEKGMTVFSRDPDGNPALYDYQIKGFFKDTCSMLKKATGSMSKDIKAHKKMIDGLIFVNPRLITLKLPDSEKIGVCQRPLRAQTAQGERVALAMSESVPAGTTMEIEITCLTDGDEKYVREWLDYGRFRGIGQWRNSGAGRFVWEEIRCY